MAAWSMMPRTTWRAMFFWIRARPASIRSRETSCRQHVIAAQRDHMGDARPHLARADDADRLDFTHKSQAFA
jgi:hypothetical protein